MIEKLATWLRAMALIPSLCLPASAFDISDVWWHHIRPSDRRSLNVAAFVIFDEILRLTPKTLESVKALKLFTLDKILKMPHKCDPWCNLRNQTLILIEVPNPNLYSSETALHLLNNCWKIPWIFYLPNAPLDRVESNLYGWIIST